MNWYSMVLFFVKAPVKLKKTDCSKVYGQLIKVQAQAVKDAFK